MSASLPFLPPTVLAPMHGVLPAELRQLVASRGPIGLVCCAFVRITRAPGSAAFLRRVVRRTPFRPCSIQLLGSGPQEMARAASVLSDAGADIVDVNLGCPVRQVVRRGAGAALLRRPDELRVLLSRVRDATRGRLSVKLRAGFETCHHALEIGTLAEAAGADFVTLHPRARRDMYRGVADWSLIAELKRSLRIPVIGNGDCWYAADAIELQRQSGCDGVMLGRPALRNPWIFRQLAELRQGQAPFEPSGADLVGHLQQLASLLSGVLARSQRGPLGPFKEHVAWALRGVPNSSGLQARALRLGRLDALLSLLERELGSLPAAALDLSAAGHHRLEHTPAPLLK